MNKIWWMHSNQLLKDLSSAEVSYLFQMMERCQYEAGQSVFSSSLPGESIFFVQQGELELLQKSLVKSEKVIATLSKGDIFGGIHLVDAGWTNTRAITLNSSEMLVLRKKSFEQVMKFFPSIGAHLVETLRTHIAEFRRDFNRNLKRQVSGRIQRLLQAYSPPHGQGLTYDTREIAELTGVSPDLVDRILRKWLDQGKILRRQQEIYWAITPSKSEL